jgi:glycosyltransferase involved in cell wall biosynthesis
LYLLKARPSKPHWSAGLPPAYPSKMPVVHAEHSVAKICMSPLISIVIPSYNHADYIGVAIDSCLNQSYAHIEVIIVDDGSTDSSVAFLTERYANHDKIELHVQQNLGAHQAIANGIALAKGEYIAILGSDDVYHPQRLEILLAEAQQRTDPQRLVLFSDIAFIDHQQAALADHDRVAHYVELCAASRHLPVAEALLVGNVSVSTSNFFFHRNVWLAVGALSALRYCHDWDWMLRASETVDCVWVNQPLLQYRVHPHNTLSEAMRHLYCGIWLMEA